ncbi:MAG: bZIP transcription factor, partial [bacterium]|nr:bZIP transcription factor [bacterium]
NAYDLHAWGDNQFVVRATGGFWFITKVDGTGYPIEGMMLPAGSSHWVPIGSTAAQLSQEQSDPVQELEAENTSLKQRIDELESRLLALEALMQSRGGDQE